MPTRTFAITADDKPAVLDDRGAGQLTVNVSNTTGRSIRGQAKLVPLGTTKSDWLTVGGEVERSFSANEAHQFVVRMTAPAGTPAGKYSFRLNIFAVQNPDSDFTEGPVVSFEVREPRPDPVPAGRSFPWFYVILAVVLVGGGVAVALLLSGDKQVPDLANKSLAEVTNELARTGFRLGDVVYTNTGTNLAGRVVLQSPEARAKAKAKSSVAVTVGTPVAPVPRVAGATVVEATKRLLESGFNVADQVRQTGTTDGNLANKIKEVEPPEGQLVSLGKTISLTMWVRQDPAVPGTRPPRGTIFIPLTNMVSRDVLIRTAPRFFLRGGTN